jgi:spermidine synthase
VLFGLPYVAGVYVAYADYGLISMLLRGAICAVLLLPPTILMGATLPAIARWVESTPKGVSWLGLLYTCNIAGGVFGSLFAGFHLLRTYDMTIATYAAAAINTALAGGAFVLAATTTYPAPAASRLNARAGRSADAWAIYLVIGLSGLAALGAQVVWTRVLALFMGATVYTFSIILAVFLIGLGVGGSIGSYLARTCATPRLALATCQLLLVGGVAWAATAINAWLPYWPIDPALTKGAWYDFQLDLARVTWAILPATCLWGASFPLALAAVASPGQDPGRFTGAAYAANTIGAIVGALAFSVVLVPAIGTFQSQRLVMGISLIAGLVAALAALLLSGHRGTTSRERLGSMRVVISGVLPAVAIASALIWIVPAPAAGLLAFGRQLLKLDPLPPVLFVREGINATVAVAEIDEGVRSFFISGRPEASSSPHDMRVQRMLAHAPALLHGKPRSVLIVGFGAGVTAGSFVLYPEVERIVICEIEPLIPQVVSTFFRKENNDVLNDPRVEVIHDDARHYLLTTRRSSTSLPPIPFILGSRVRPHSTPESTSSW